MVVRSTRLRYISAKDIVSLVSFVDALPFKVEIKGNPVVKGNRWYLFFIIPDSQLKFNSIDLE